MTTIHEKIMAVDRPRYCRVSAYKAGFEAAIKAAADIAEAEVHRMEAKISRLQKLVSDNCGPDNC